MIGIWRKKLLFSTVLIVVDHLEGMDVNML